MQKPPGDNEVDVKISDASVAIQPDSPKNESNLPLPSEVNSLDSLGTKEEDCLVCPFHTKKTNNYAVNTIRLAEGEMLHDFEGSTASNQTLETFVDQVSEGDIFSLMQTHKKIIAKDNDKCTAAFHLNSSKNRFADIHCYEETRVKVKHPSESHDYVNASWLDGYQERKKFIIAQTPMNHTLEHFWSMIWQEKTLLVVCMNPMYDDRKPESNIRYIPKKCGEEVIYGSLKIINMGVKHVRDTYDATILKVSGNNETRTMLHICYYAWRKGKTPVKPTELLNLVADLNNNRTILRDKAMSDGILKKGSRFPVLIHCISGIGRSCTLAALDILVNKLDDTRRRSTIQPLVDIKDTVVRIRTQRALALQKSDYFVMLHLLICEHAVRCKYLNNATISSLSVDNYKDSKKSEME